MRTSIRYIVKRDRHVQCIIDESDAFVLYTFKAINLFFVGQKLLSKNAICVRMNLREMSKLSLAANIKKYIVQTFEPCVKQRFAPQTRSLLLIIQCKSNKKSKIVYNLGMKRRTHIKWEGFLNCKDLMKLPFVMSITHGKFIISREKLLWQPFLNWCRLIKSFSLSLSLSHCKISHPPLLSVNSWCLAFSEMSQNLYYISSTCASFLFL